MHPLITAWNYYLWIAAIQPEYGSQYYVHWIIACKKAKEWIDELTAQK